jgi:hypothetical protein
MPFTINYVHQNEKTPAGRKIYEELTKKQEQFVLQLANSGDFEAIAAFVASVEISDDVVCKVFQHRKPRTGARAPISNRRLTYQRTGTSDLKKESTFKLSS